MLEVVTREDAALKPGDRVYIGSGVRDKVKTIRGKLKIEELTATAQSELDDTIRKQVSDNADKFVEFFNKSGPVTTRQHQLELLPGIGKKHMWQIIGERKKAPFKDFSDIKKRVTLLPDPKKAIVKRIMAELEGETKWHIFTVPPKRDDDEY